ncbi:MFS transporter [Streptomyces sp. NPDC048291]|uniref:MFS transporter n=1 Tax=Streptomyces sp. NPDC048291 TaxID=3365530 RepID=UPI003712F093
MSGQNTGGHAPAERLTIRHLLSIVAVSLVIGNANFEFTLITGGLPDIAAEFRTTEVVLVMTVVFVASLVFLPITGRLADLYGKKRILLVVSAVFMAGSALCALTTVYWLFLAGRVLQSSFVVAYVAGYGLMRDILPPRLVPLGVGGITIGTGVSVFVGPLLGGWLIDNHGFRSAFWFELCYALVAAVLVLLLVPESPARERKSVDVLGGLLMGLGMAALVYCVVKTSMTPVLVPVGVVLLALFVVVERRREEPLVSMELLGRPQVWWPLLAAGMGMYALTAGTTLLAEAVRIPHIPGLADRGLGWTALEFGLYVGVPYGLVGALTGVPAGWVCRRYSPRAALLIAVLATTAGLLVMLASRHGGVGAAVTAAVLQGIALGFFYTAANNLVIEAVPADQQGIGTSLLYTVLGTANGIGSAAITTITARHTRLTEGSDHAVVVTDTGFELSILVLLAGGVVSVVLTLLMRHGRTPATGGATADLKAGMSRPGAVAGGRA